jgi:hypothetical protein
MEPIIVSIPHTGTRFLQQRLGVEKSVHTISKWGSLYNQVEGKQIFAPLRHPTDVWKSWARRKKGPFPYAEFFSAWYIMHTLDMLFDVDFICLDKRDDPRITDWAPIGQDDPGNPGVPLIELRPLFSLPFVKKHYG